MTKYKLNKYIVIFVAALLSVAGSVSAERRVWSLADGTTFEAELMTVFATEAVFKNARGSVHKIPLNLFSPESLNRIELENPPKLSFDFIKSEDSIVFPAGVNEATQRPSEERCHYGIRIKQKSSGNYKHELHVELFVIGKERYGDKLILLDRQETSFFLTAENKKEFEFRSKREVALQNYEVEGHIRGERYHGYLAVVKDERGEVIEVDTSHDYLYENIKALRERYVGNFMDETCVRVFPTRPDVL